ncbi:amino acid ABC transporter [Vibrio cholerae MAK 757]|uniref:Amino acid ABC transporter, permease protein n=13 Tax=Pseudomonadota TaxID=1224 RepID=Q9KQY5_VIBCH|nr:amino acid ABC transporter, permease protein [Vibrio cholerae O1 biovar El Tor str. N16961]ACP06091.1 amino acid ABC transporter, permease protein [Vibrio cholerae M66-2]ACQ60666.1 arginine/ornithine ABC transporter permease protein AotQ [Vibrio cholerae MJ-1236]EAZ73181.1 amino acid ABC transporter, permease protein [Vibrio cholerae NCTC 8457]EAZ75732.1 amino acid ABC transporter, permease protein [Vibrio cholerae B33]EEN98375.1 arginine/ornithine ABC transporter permease protein AotQ [Vib
MSPTTRNPTQGTSHMLDLQGYEASILKGALLTIEVAVLSLLLAMLLGMLGALAKMAPYRWARAIATLYTTIIRGIPDLVLMMLIFFGGQILLNNGLSWFNEFINQWLTARDPNHEWVAYLPDYVDISPFVAGVLTIGFIFGAYMAETFRGAILAVDKGELEAAKAYGMSAAMSFRRILLPQMIRHAIPGFGNNWLVLLKTTALVSIIGLEDMVRISSLAAGSTKMPFTFYMAVAIIFLFFTSVSTGLLKLLERKFSIHTR